MNQNILIIDDDQDELELFKDALQCIDRNESFRCFYAGDAVEALQMLKTLKPDYIFVDFNMPGMNGLEFLVEIKKKSRLPKTQTFLHSTSITDGISRVAMLAGATGCIRKVNSIRELANELLPVLSAHPKPVPAFLPGHSGNG